MSEKLIVDWNEYNKTVERLAIQVHESGYKPTLLVGIMRGGAPMIDVLSRVFKLKCAYLAVESYSGKGVEDEQGNIYYTTRDEKRRWVIFNGEAEASRVNADWHGWLHHTYKETPLSNPLIHKNWEKPHQENLTGTKNAHKPNGSLLRELKKNMKKYETWKL